MAMKDPQISAELWIENLLWAAEQIADRKFQESRWLAADRYAWESPNEAINTLDDFVLDGFIEQFAESFSPPQAVAVIAFRDEVDRFCKASPKDLEATQVLADPGWQAVRSKACAFVKAFKGRWPESA